MTETLRKVWLGKAVWTCKGVMGDEVREYDGKILNAKLMRADLTLWQVNRANNLVSILQMKKLWHLHVTGLVQGHPAREWQSQSQFS